MDMQREVTTYLSSFGSGLDIKAFTRSMFEGRDEIAQEESGCAVATWWTLSEDIVLQLIAVAVQELSLSDDELWLSHPAHKDMPENPIFVKSSGAAGMDAVLKPRRRSFTQ